MRFSIYPMISWSVICSWEVGMRHSDDRVIREFERRRKRLMLNFGFTLICFILGLVLIQIADTSPGLLGIGRRWWMAAAVAQLFAGVIMAVTGFLQYRCPVCDQIIRGHDKYFFGILLKPGKCPECGARLEE